jgi:hypothetical protein
MENKSRVGRKNGNECERNKPNYHFSLRHGLAAWNKRKGESSHAVKRIMIEDACVEYHARARIDLEISKS